ncbi:MAG: 23S rRNA (guanosine(2251)-2'-O)-methyltransferase RlmB [Legionellaceae bacterium]|nr:23S rRNA (guanosine(2251)-2'-O)-methyltransferase RlmB [Legionellaceae bacterium]
MSEQLIYGIHAVTSLLNSPHKRIKKIIINKDRSGVRVDKILELASQFKLVIEEISAKEMERDFPDVVHQGVVAVANPLPQYSEQDIPFLIDSSADNVLILILDGVTDPHNLGACLRVADAAGASFVIIPKDKNATITPVVSKVACGAAEFIPLIRVTNLARTIKELKKQGIWIYGTDLSATESIYKLDCKVPLAFVMGAEGDGMRRLTRESCDVLCTLPMLGSVASLNVSVASGISLYEVVRQRLG